MKQTTINAATSSASAASTPMTLSRGSNAASGSAARRNSFNAFDASHTNTNSGTTNTRPPITVVFASLYAPCTQYRIRATLDMVLLRQCAAGRRPSVSGAVRFGKLFVVCRGGQDARQWSALPDGRARDPPSGHRVDLPAGRAARSTRGLAPRRRPARGRRAPGEAVARGGAADGRAGRVAAAGGQAGRDGGPLSRRHLLGAGRAARRPDAA